ncbi:cadherin-like domain-containing protein [Methylomonas albis]|uniref:DUF4347 domain-containing protein n=1 Tax=Methylomonas albis TaxID=1854563 RepID=A0ABR9D418_9GAMM|nr:cadherin-like domain-containing protein [Methylomonas albis]MBD9357825.1 DUF4347 domain-containing protein [Methylomonas albis]
MSSKSPLKHYHSKPILEELEARQLFSGGVEGLLTEQLVEANAVYVNADATPPAEIQQPATQTSASETTRNEIVFVDTRVDNYQSLLNDIKSSDVSDRNLEIITLDSSSDGIQQISQILAERDNLDAVHIISHGSDGSLDLGNSQLNFDTLIQNQTDISAWGNAFKDSGDIMLYGCNVAETQFGQSFVDYLSGITNTEVAASTDATGSSDLGGDWQLEYQTGTIEAQSAVSVEFQQQWSDVLAVTSNGTVTSTQTLYATSLTWSHTVNAGVDRVLFVEIAIDDVNAGVNSVKYGTADLTRVGRTAANHAVEIWALINPTEGTDNVVISFTGNTEAAAGASTFNGVNQSTPYGTYAGNTGTTGLLGGSGTVNVASATGDLVIDVQYWKAISADTTGTGQTSQWTSSSLLSTAKAGSSAEEGASSVTMSGSALLAANWSIGAVSVKASTNIAPVNTVPAAQTSNEDTAKVFSSANGNAITIADVDAGGANNEITLTVTNGTLTLAGTSGLTFVTGDGTADVTMTFRGTASAINTALDGLSYTPTANYNGSGTLTVSTKDSVLLSLDIDTSLKGRYTFDNTGVLGTDTSPAAGYNGTVVNGTSVNDATRGNVLSLAGNGYIHTTGHFGNSANLTLAAWVNLTTADTNGAMVISLGDSVGIALDDGGRLNGFYYNGINWPQTFYTTTLAGAGWHHVAFSFDDAGNMATLYLDGVAVGSTATTDSISYTLGVDSFIGKHGDGATTWDFNGKIDDARIYNRVLTASEIATLATDLSKTDTDIVAITVSAINDAPVLNTTVGTLSYTENAGATVVDSLLTVTDLDSTNLASATVTISSGFASGEDTLAFTNQNGISGSWDASTGVLTLTGSSSVANYQTALRSVTYANSSDSPSTATRTVSFAVNDGSLSSASATRNITITAVNDAPVLTSASLALNEGDTVTLSAANFGVSDPDNASFTYTVSSVAGGYFQLTSAAGTPISSFTTAQLAAGQVQFVDDGNEVAPSFSVTVNDGSLDSNTLAATINYTGVNDAPVLTSASLTLNEGETVTLSAANFGVSDPDNASFTYTVSSVAGGYFQLTSAAGTPITSFTTAQLAAGQVQFVDDGNEVAPSFSVTVNDGVLDSNTLAATINYTGVNDAPVLTSASLSLNEGQTVTLSAANFGVTDPDNASFTYTVSSVAGGYFQLTSAAGTPITSFTTAQLAAGQVQFVDDGNEVAPSFSVTVNDGALDSNTLAATINYTGVNDAPVISTASLTLNEGQTVTLSAANFGVTDPDNASFTYTVSSVAGGYFQLTSAAGTPITSFTTAQLAAGQVQFVDDGNEVAPSFSVTVNDGALDSNTLAATINYTAVNDAPVISTASLTLNEGETVTLSAANFGVSDPDNASFTYTVSSVTGGYFQLTTNPGVSVASFSSANLAAGQVQFVDDGNEVAPSFSVTVNDGVLDSNTLAATINYTGVNDAPVLTSASLSLNEGQTVTLSAANFGVTDPDNASFTYTVSSVAGGYFQLTSAAGTPITSFTTAQLAAGQVQFVDDGNEVAPSFSVTVNDGALDSNTLAATINYTGVNDAPVISTASLTLNEGETVTLSAANFGVTDPDNASFTYTVSSVAGGYFQLTSAAGTPITSFTTAQLAAGQVQFVDDGNEVAPSFSVTVNDGALDSNTLAATINYTAVNDAPVISTASLTLNEGETVTLSAANFGVSDPDNASFTYTVSSVTGGYFQLTTNPGVSVASFSSANLAAGQVQFVDDGNEVAPSFSVTVNDGVLDSNTLAATINYTGVNDAPVLTSASLSLNEGQTVTLSAANFGVTDPDNASVTYTVSSVAGGYFQLTSAAGTPITSFTTAQLAAGQVQFVDDGNEVAPSFDITVSDGNLSSNTLSATISYTAVNDAPVISNASLTLNEGETVTLSAANFGVTDLDNASFTYTVASVAGGYFQLTTNPGVSVASFSSANLAAGQVQFVDDGNEVAPSFSVTVNDGIVSSSPVAASINYVAADDTTNTLQDIITYNQKNGLNDKNQGENTQSNSGSSHRTLTNQFEVIDDLNAHIDKLTNEVGKDNKAIGDELVLAPTALTNDVNITKFSELSGSRSSEEQRNENGRKYHLQTKHISFEQYNIDSQTAFTEHEEMEFWNRLENIRKQMSDPEVVADANPVNIKIILGTSAGLTAGFVSWILRAGSLLASLMSTVPLLKRFDPLPIMRSVKKTTPAKNN